MKDLLDYFDAYLSRQFDPGNGIIYIEDYIDVQGADSGARKAYIEYYKKKKNIIIAAILYNQPTLFKSVLKFQKDSISLRSGL